MGLVNHAEKTWAPPPIHGMTDLVRALSVFRADRYGLDSRVGGHAGRKVDVRIHKATIVIGRSGAPNRLCGLWDEIQGVYAILLYGICLRLDFG